mgnify:CR=1 FL=1|uniref:Uncharacterized protein n=1 Tax=candidate division WOR-3 bacterium TaxID=2052148 RepID=A0A7C3IZA3_UNCW3
MSKTAVLPVIYILALCSGVFAAPAVYYYLYEYTAVSPKEAVILEMQSDNPTPPGSEFTPVTVEQLHEKGYQTPSEYAETLQSLTMSNA